MVHRGWATEGRRVLMRVVTILITRCKAAGQAGSLKGSSSQQNSGLRRANSKHGVFQHPLASLGPRALLSVLLLGLQSVYPGINRS